LEDDGSGIEGDLVMRETGLVLDEVADVIPEE
jgi:hypothetical protein